MRAFSDFVFVFLMIGTLLFPVALLSALVLFITGFIKRRTNGAAFQKAAIRVCYISSSLLFLLQEICLPEQADQLFTSSGDMFMGCMPASRITGYVLAGILLVVLLVVDLRMKKKSTRLLLPLSLLLASVLWMNTQAMVIGTNGMRLYYYHFRSYPGFGSVYIGKLDDRPKPNGNPKQIYWGLSEQDGNDLQKRGELITGVVITGSTLTFIRPNNTPYRMWYHLAFWEIDLRAFLRMLPKDGRFIVTVLP